MEKAAAFLIKQAIPAWKKRYTRPAGRSLMGLLGRYKWPLAGLGGAGMGLYGLSKLFQGAMGMGENLRGQRQKQLREAGGPSGIYGP